MLLPKHFSLNVGMKVLLLTIVALVPPVVAKSLYVNQDLNSPANSPIGAYNVDPITGCLSFQMASGPTRYGGVGLALDNDNEKLLVTFEGSGMLDTVDAKTLQLLSQVTAPQALNLAGIVVDETNKKVYAVDRNTNKLYAYDWNGSTDPPVMTLLGGGTGPTHLLTHTSRAYGIELDEVNEELYVSDNVAKDIDVYSTVNWSHKRSIPVVALNPMDVALDLIGGFLYTGNMFSSNDLVQIDVTSDPVVEDTLDISDHVVGIAVDQWTGFVYITTRDDDTILIFDRSLNPICTSPPDIGTPTGIVIGQVSYNPLDVSIDDGLAADECIMVWDELEYTICYSNPNAYVAEAVTLVDHLPDDCTCTDDGGGTSNEIEHTVTFDIGNLAANSPQECQVVKASIDVAAASTNLMDHATIEFTAGANTIQTTTQEETAVCSNTDPCDQVCDNGSSVPMYKDYLLFGCCEKCVWSIFNKLLVTIFKITGWKCGYCD